MDCGMFGAGNNVIQQLILAGGYLRTLYVQVYEKDFAEKAGHILVNKGTDGLLRAHHSLATVVVQAIDL